MHLFAGDLASEIKLVSLQDTIKLVYDHNHILNEAQQKGGLLGKRTRLEG